MTLFPRSGYSKRVTMAVQIWIISAFFLTFSPPLRAHPNGTSKLNISIFKDTIEAIVYYNKDDILNAVAGGRAYSMNRQELKEVYDRIVHYITARVLVEIDGNRVSPVKVVPFTEKGDPEKQRMDSVDFQDTTLASRWISRHIHWGLDGLSDILQKIEHGKVLIMRLRLSQEVSQSL